MMPREHCFLHGTIITIDGNEFVSRVQGEDNFPRDLTKQIYLRIMKPA